MEKIIYKRKFKEADEEAASKKAIKDLIDLNWGENEDHQNTALQLLKGLVYADTKTADKFLQDLSDFTSKMKPEEYDESCSGKKKPIKKKGMKEGADKGEVEFLIRSFQKAKAIHHYDNNDIEEIIDNINSSRGKLSVEDAVRRYFNLQDWEDEGF